MTDSDKEIEIVITHPKVDILKLLSGGDLDAYRLTKELGITYRTCYSHLKALEEFGLIGGVLKYHITERGRQMLSRFERR